MSTTIFSSLLGLETLAGMETEEAQIARGLRRSDPDLIGRLVQQYAHPLMRYLLYVTANQALAEDLFQETWLRVLEKGSLYDGRAKFKTWLLAIARNLTIDYMRRKKVVPMESLERDPDEQPIEPPSEMPSPFEAVSSGETQERIAAALATVPALYREAVVLRFQQELSLAEIAQMVGVPVPTVKSRLYRGVMALRPALEGMAR
jgi:RNA polymerase sigma-70 factor (ECF subfamily)